MNSFMGKTFLLSAVVLSLVITAFSQGSLTPLQLAIEKQRVRLASADAEERRDAASRLGAMRHHAASRAAIAGLKDSEPIVRATSISAVLSLPPDETAGNLMPLLSDKDILVRREAAYAVGTTKSLIAIPLLIDLLRFDKVDEVRGAAAVALGTIGNEAAVSPLLAVLTGQAAPDKKQKTKPEQNPFVLRSAARALGQIGSRGGIPVLIATLANEESEDDVRREAAIALGKIGDQSAIPALRNVAAARDPHLAAAADVAIKSILRPSR
ncbi:MAG TPA: HEAT repeat domain-containing protein [Pyrinomonadaceae bacterium]|nr:HEAT repeat domain-containing protein [Pyrinomonadaceae bacterium]